jgi:hypothetical protein
VTRPTPDVAATVDPALALTVIGAVAATLVAVWLYFYLPLASASGRWFLGRTRQRIARSRRLLSVRRLGRILWLMDVSIVISWRACVALYATLVFLLVIPALLAVGSLAMASSMIRF